MFSLLRKRHRCRSPTPTAEAMDNPSVEAIFNDYMGRRAGIIRALTDDVDEFFAICNPDQKNLFLYGYPDGSWEVTPPADEVPPEIPEPPLGINFARDQMARKDWLSMIAVHSDSWLLSVAFFRGGRFTGDERRHLFSLINEVPTVFEAISHQRTSGGQINADSLPVEEERFGENEHDKDNENFRGRSGGKMGNDEFWIACDICGRWFHGKCVQMMPAKTERNRHRCRSSTPTAEAMDDHSVEAIFNEYMGRRAGIIRALTDDVDEFFALCNPDQKNLFLYGYPNGSWEVTLPADEVPPEIPEPPLGINFARDQMARKDWLSMIAVHSDSWLLSVAFFRGGRFTGDERRHLFSLINEVPTVFEAISHQRTSGGQINADSLPVEEEGFGENEHDKDNENLCGSCGGKMGDVEFWIACDTCERWFHDKCVQMKPAKIESNKKYKCPDCNSKGGME